jgi:GT2 family glycosyltransferase
VQKILLNTFTPPHPLKTAVLFLGFNRPDTTKQVFEEIRQAKPPRLYVAADGPRAVKDEEGGKCERVRRIATQVDWDCEVKTLFRDRNLGCRLAVSSAIDWFFESEEEGIILEDDCLPSQSFFWFCEELLERYREDERIMIVSGYNKQETWKQDKYDYFFSYFGGIWGWASWRRAWNLYDGEMKDLDCFIENNYFEFLLGKRLGNVRKMQMINIIQNDVDTWDFPWGFSRHVNSGLACVPSKSLIENIGFGPEATHTFGKNRHVVKKYKINLPTTPNTIIVPDLEYDMLFHGKPSFFSRLIKKALSYVQKK